MSIDAFVQEKGWSIGDSNIALILVDDVVHVTRADDDSAIVRIRRNGTTVALGVGLLRVASLVVDVNFGRITFTVKDGVLSFVAFTYEPGPSPSGGGTSIGPPTTT